MPGPIRVLIVDDAVVVRQILKESLSQDPAIEVVGAAIDGVYGLEKVASLSPDVVVLDVEMPNMDGIETLAAIKKNYPGTKVVMFSTLTERGARATMDAMMLGADDYVTKPSNVGGVTESITRIQAELVPKIKALAGPTVQPAAVRPGVRPVAARLAPKPQLAPGRPLAPPRPAVVKAPPAPAVARIPGHTGKVDIVAIAVSTGGPNALSALLPALPADLAAPIVIVQHIPPLFSKALADGLDGKCALKVAEGAVGAPIAPGQIWIAPGDYHMMVKRDQGGARLDMNQGPQENSCRPAADVLFRSVAASYGPGVLAVVLTGMGSDGLAGSQAIANAGGRVVAQDQASSVVWGMPGAVAEAGVAEKVIPLHAIAAEITARVGTLRVSGDAVSRSR